MRWNSFLLTRSNSFCRVYFIIIKLKQKGLYFHKINTIYSIYNKVTINEILNQKLNRVGDAHDMILKSYYFTSLSTTLILILLTSKSLFQSQSSKINFWSKINSYWHLQFNSSYCLNLIPWFAFLNNLQNLNFWYEKISFPILFFNKTCYMNILIQFRIFLCILKIFLICCWNIEFYNMILQLFNRRKKMYLVF